MKVTFLKIAATAALLPCTANAADIHLGLSVEGTGIIVADAPGLGIVPGVSISATTPLSQYFSARARLSAGAFVLPILRLDGTILSRGATYFGVGLGSGVALGTGDITLTQGSAVGLINVHALVGRNFKAAQVELQARAGIIYSAGLSVNYLLPNR
ncbi:MULTISPECIES: hypothetical protein [Deinococcus]|uniref:DUF4402 domain-containing protein n=1 Tax=Deinococcus cavernae TaxID=2320857 RepID=A0A418VAH7_9DEIO|nr:MULTISPECIES: hypothetical protein [Deinococcus]RJF73069.1 hypothetical protein D3875_17490 [Deinococcus cavernae]